MSTSVKHIHSGMRGAPTINGVVGAGIIPALDTLFNTGWGVTTAIAVSVASGIATATLTSGETFDRDAVVLIAGATPGDLNGEARVLTTSLTSITWATTAADGVATGTITIKYAPQTDWVKVYAGTNKAAYRSNHVQSRGRYLRIDDTGTTTARVRGYESMTDVDTGTGPFPTDAQMSGGGHWHKSVFANATAVKYRIFCDERFVLIEIAAGYSGGVNNIGAVASGFGDPIELSPSGDAWATLLSFNGVNATFVGRASFADASDSSADGQTVFPRALVGLGGSVQGVTAPFTGSGVSGGVATLGVAPSAVDGQIKTSRVLVRETGANLPPRAVVPGVLFIPQSGAYGLLQDGDRLDGSGDLAGRRLLVVASHGASTNYNTTPTACHLVDIT